MERNKDPTVYGCCKKPTMWIFVYNDDSIFSICKTHFYSIAHRINVRDVVNFQTKISYTPKEIFAQFPIV